MEHEWTNIVEFISKQYPDSTITKSVKELITQLESNGLILDIDDRVFFYQSSDETIQRALIDKGFLFKLSDTETTRDKNSIIKTEKNYIGNSISLKKTRLVFDEKHPESFYASTRNIAEMKLMMMDYGIKYCESSYYFDIFQQNNDELEKYFAAKIQRTEEIKNDTSGAIIRYNTTKKSSTFHYRLVDLEGTWKYSEEWVRFFWEIGKYVDEYNGNLSIFISYLSRAIPASITSAGIMDSYLRNLSNEYIDNLDVEALFKKGEEVSYKDGIKWRTAEVLSTEIIDSKSALFNPYLKIKVIRPKQLPTIESVPRSLWETKIRSGGVVSKSPGTSTVVTFNDRISEVVEQRYGKEVVESIRINSQLHINLIGRRANKQMREVLQGIQFADSMGTFMLSDLLYLDNDKESNYINVHMVSSLSVKKNNDSDSISVFVGAKAALDFYEYKTNRNIYFTSMIRQNYVEDTELLINHLQQESSKSHSVKLIETKKIRDYLSSMGIGIPKGVEIFVF